MAFGKRPIVCKFGDLGEERSMYTQTNTLTGKSCTIAVHSGSLAFMVPELIIEELSIINNKIFSFLFSACFSFLFSFLFSKSVCIFVNSSWSRGAIDGQLSLHWSRSAIAFLLTLLGLEVSFPLLWSRSAIAFSFSNFPRDLAMP